MDQTIVVLNMVDCKTLAQGTLYANKELDDYKLRFMMQTLDNWGHTTVILQKTRNLLLWHWRMECDIAGLIQLWSEAHRHIPNKVQDTPKERIDLQQVYSGHIR